MVSPPGLPHSHSRGRRAAGTAAECSQTHQTPAGSPLRENQGEILQSRSNALSDTDSDPPPYKGRKHGSKFRNVPLQIPLQERILYPAAGAGSRQPPIRFLRDGNPNFLLRHYQWLIRRVAERHDPSTLCGTPLVPVWDSSLLQSLPPICTVVWCSPSPGLPPPPFLSSMLPSVCIPQNSTLDKGPPARRTY